MQMADLPDTLVFATLPNTEMCWLTLQAGRIYVRQHPHDAQLFFFDCVNMAVITIIVTSITSTETQCACSLRLAPQCPAFL